MPTPPKPTPAESLIEYPSLFPIKVMGTKVDGLVHAITQIAAHFDPTFDASTIELRESKGGKYLGVTLTVTATPSFRSVMIICSVSLAICPLVVSALMAMRSIF